MNFLVNQPGHIYYRQIKTKKAGQTDDEEKKSPLPEEWDLRSDRAASAKTFSDWEPAAHHGRVIF